MKNMKVKIKTIEELLATKGIVFEFNVFHMPCSKGMATLQTMKYLSGKELELVYDHPRVAYVENTIGSQHLVYPWMCSEWNKIDPREEKLQQLIDNPLHLGFGIYQDLQIKPIANDLQTYSTYNRKAELSLFHRDNIIHVNLQKQDIVDIVSYLQKFLDVE